MIAHSVNMFRNCWVIYDLSTENTILYRFPSTGRGKKLNEPEKKANSWTKTATVISRKNIESNKKES